MMFIILDSSQADAVRGPSQVDPSASLNPIERAGSIFILGVGVLSDVAHEPHWTLLGSLPRLDLSDPSFPGEIEV